jgi:hypothetical protein
MKHLFAILIIALSLILPSAIAFPVGATQQGYLAASSTAPSWAVAGTFLNYTFNGNLGFSLTLSNGSTLSYSGIITGWYNILVNGISNNEASVTTTPNFNFSSTLKYFNGTTKTSGFLVIPANGTETTNVPLGNFSFGDYISRAMNEANSSYFFSPHLNASYNQSPGVLYQWKSGNIPAIHLSSSVSTQATFPGGVGGLSGSYSISGQFESYSSMVQNIPLKVTLNMQGSATISNLQSLLVSSGTGSGNVQLTIMLTNTNVDLSAGNVQQASIQIPAYSASLNVISNSTISSAGTSGNRLVVNVTGQSGTEGVMNVVVSQSMLAKAGIASISQVVVTVDGQAYTNYTVTNLGGSYVFTIYYHHSSHSVTLVFGNANLGTNYGTISSLSGSSLFGGISTETLIIIAVAIVAVIVIAFALLSKNRSKYGAMQTATGAVPTNTPTVTQ